MSEQNQTRLLEVLNYLWNYTDKEHYTTIVEILKYLETKGIAANRKTVAGDIISLQQIGGIKIVCIKSTQNRYYVNKRFFDENAVRVICDAVRSAYFISDKSGRALINTLSTFTGPSEKKNLKTPVFVDAMIKTKNDDVIKNIGKITDAITERRKITFKYFDYTVDKTKIYKNNGKVYEVTPCSMVINDGKYYIAAYEKEADLVKTFRIDKMDRLRISSFTADPIPKSFSVKKFAESTNMFGGYVSEVELLCDNDVMFGIIDKFGKDVTTEAVDSGHFKVTATADISPTFFGWVVGFGGKIKITGPKSIVVDFENSLKECKFNK